ncbi:MAG: response regulator transcription factor [Melioribacteraceae bacterium]|nr:response regulator transcription factor [Melioribacteraceae bacterium]MCF8353598.1 response regulator transcription factor [Melioribacteraceae bacterium]MCF8393521.1 response regulator transcription factor [Melioribacteraceae bacterium]MCF8419331.1 response regulator transcription factor [Melioribacteraceae bacterium]
MKKVLIIEDDIEIADLVKIHLRDLDCEVTKAFDGKTGLNLALANTFDLIILDIMLPEMDGFDVCKNIRKNEDMTPVLMLTSKSEEMDKVLGLEFGADDYMVKPFGIREFIARVKAIFRRVESLEKTKDDLKDMHIGKVIIEGSKRKVLVGKDRIDLTPKEFELLYLLASNPGKTFTRESLLNQIWGYQYSGYEHTVNSHINRLRGKIESDIANPEYILTTWGVGYRFNDQI